MVQFQKPKKIYNDRRFPYNIPGAISNDNSSSNYDRRGNRNKANAYMQFGPQNGAPRRGMHPSRYPVSWIPLPPYPGGPHSQPYAIPSRGAIHGPIGGIPHAPQSGNRGFGAGRGNTSGPISGRLSHQQNNQHVDSSFGLSTLDSPNSQPTAGGPLSQTGLMSRILFSG